MENTEFVKGQRVNTPEGPGEIIEIVGDILMIRLNSGGTESITKSMISNEVIQQTVVGDETEEAVISRAMHAHEIVEKLEQDNNQNNPFQTSQQQPMEISENSLDMINDLIQINNDRVEGFEKAAGDLQEEDSGLVAVFNKLAEESRQNVAELTDIVEQYGGEAAEGTSTSGDLHRAWLDVKSIFTGGDLESVLNECERGEDAIKAAYASALDPEQELSPELKPILQKQQMAIDDGHDLIKSLRDQASDDMVDEDDEDEELVEDDDYNGLNNANPIHSTNAVSIESVYSNGTAAEEPSYEGAVGEYGHQPAFVPEPESIEQEEAWEEEQVTATGNSKLMEFFVDELKDLLWAERELAETLPDMAEAATSQELKNAFTNHQAETEVHITRLEQIFGILGLEPDTTKCDAMAGIVDEGDEIISNTDEGTAQRDVGLIFAGQKAEHYEIASYGGMISLAKTLGYYEIAELLVMTIDEEKTADALLTEIAENHVNYEASTEAAD